MMTVTAWRFWQSHITELSVPLLITAVILPSVFRTPLGPAAAAAGGDADGGGNAIMPTATTDDGDENKRMLWLIRPITVTQCVGPGRTVTAVNCRTEIDSSDVTEINGHHLFCV